MAEPTEQEQLKTNQLLTKVESSAAETSHKMEELISAVKQPATYETDLLKEIKDQGEEQAQTDKKTLKSQKAFHEDVKELTKNSGTEKVHNKFMETMEKKKVGLQEAVIKDKKREDKLATREDSKVGKWFEKNWDGFKKTTGDWLGTVAKLMALVGAWFALNWLKGKDLKKMWEDFLKWAEQFVKDLKDMMPNLKDMDIGGTIAKVIAAWLAWKASIALGTKLFTTSTETTKGEVGKDGKLTKQITKLNTQLEELRTKQNAFKRAQKMVTSLEAKSAISEQLRLTNEKITALEAEIEAKTTAMNRASNLADNLSEKGKISKELKKANKALAKATAKNNAIAESIKWSKNFNIDSKLGKQLQESNEKFETARADKMRLIHEQRTNEVNRGRIRANLDPLKPGQWVGKDGLVREGGVGAGEAGTGKVVKGMKAQTQFFGAKEFTRWEKFKNWFEKQRSSLNKVPEKIEKSGKFGKNVMGMFKAGGFFADLAWRLTKAFEPARGWRASRESAIERGEDPAMVEMHGIGGLLHGGGDVFATLIGFFGQVGKLLQEGIIRPSGMALGYSEKTRDRMVKEITGSKGNPFHWLTMADEGIQELMENIFGSWKDATKMQAKMQEEGKEFSFMDIFGLGDTGGGEGFNRFWTAYWSGLRKNDPKKEAMERMAIREEEEKAKVIEFKKKGFVQNFAGKWIDPKNDPATKLLEAIKDAMIGLGDEIRLQNEAKKSLYPPQSNTFIQSNPTSYRGGSRSAIDPNQGLLGANPYQFYG